MQNFQGKVAVITGVGRGIGKGIALRCGKEGMQVVLAGPNLGSLQNTRLGGSKRPAFTPAQMKFTVTGASKISY